MSGWLGALAGGGMLILICVLVFAFLRQIGRVGQGFAQTAGRVAAAVLSAGVVFFGLGALLQQVIFQNLESAADYPVYFHTEYLSRVYEAVQEPRWLGPLTGVFVFAAHGLGRVLFEQVTLASIVLSWGMTMIAAGLVFCRLRGIWPSRAAWRGVFLLLCLPGSVFFFLPGWPPMALLLVAALFFFLGKKLPAGQVRLSDAGYFTILSVSALLSSFVMAALVLGRLG